MKTVFDLVKEGYKTLEKVYFSGIRDRVEGDVFFLYTDGILEGTVEQFRRYFNSTVLTKQKATKLWGRNYKVRYVGFLQGKVPNSKRIIDYVEYEKH